MLLYIDSNLQLMYNNIDFNFGKVNHMKKLLLILIVLLTCLGCSTGHNKPDTENVDKITEENSIWVINPYNPVSYDEYYSTERTVEFYGNNNLKAKTEGLYCNYSAETNGIFVYTLQDENQFDGTYTERQFILKPTNLQTYLTSYSKSLYQNMTFLILLIF